MTELTILMPCLNEAETLATCIGKAAGFLNKFNIEGEILIADNGSTDGSPGIAIKNGASVISVKEKGYGNALIAGIRAAKGRYVIMGDADDSYDFSALQPFVEKLREGCHLVMGNRFKGGISKGAMPWLHRYLGNPVLSFAGRLFFKSTTGDFHCGLRGFDRDKILQIGLVSPGMEFASEMVVKATIAGLQIAEVPTKLYADGRTKPPHLNTWRDGWRHLVFLLIYSPKWLFLFPSLILFVISLTGLILLLPGTLYINRLGLDIHTLTIAGMSAVLSYQLFLFAVFIRIYSIKQGLYPPGLKHQRFLKIFTLEKGIAAGLFLIVTGSVPFVFLLTFWAGSEYGNIYETGYTFRLLIPSLTLVSLGILTVFSSFFLRILNLQKHNSSTDEMV